MEKPQLHPEAVALLNSFKERNLKPYYEMPLKEARERSRLGAALMNGAYDEYQGTRRELFIPSPDVKEGVAVYVYQPASTKPDPTLYVYVHGGGFVVGTRDSVDSMCKRLVDAADGTLVIVSVSYRLAPEFPAPAAMDDAICATRWVQQNKVKLGGSEKSKVGVGGDSAGGTIAASVAHDVPDLAYQILIYPHVWGKGCTLPSFTKFVDGPLLDKKLCDWFEDHYYPKGHEEDPRIASINRGRFDHLPPCLFIVAEIDPLIDESYEYAKKLTAAGVPNELMMIKGAIHAFYTSPGVFKEATKEPYAKTVEFIKKYGNVS